jgi:cysteine desulfurase
MTMRIYFDNSATTPLDPRVTEAMLPFISDIFGNPSSLHWAGRQARQVVDHARGQVARLLNAAPDEIVFTASGTEADNMALIGVVEALRQPNMHMITSAIEHPAVLETCRYLERRGVQVTYLPVTSDGLVDPLTLVDAMRPNTRLVSIMAANNVIGTVQPILELGLIAHEHGALFHTDAVQAVGKIPLDMSSFPVDLLSLSAHKLHGPKGVGALYIRKGTPIEPLVHGGGQERGFRSATENVVGIVGLGKAAEIAQAEISIEASDLVRLRDRIIDTLIAHDSSVYLIGHRFRRLPGHICLGLAGREGEAIRLLLALDEAGIAVSTGSACSANHASEPSYILQAMGFDPVRARGSLRITLGRFNTEEEVCTFLTVFPRLIAKPVAVRAS